MRLRLDDGAELFYTIDDFTDPWTQPETVVLHHGMAKSHKLWFGWVPVIARHYRVLRYDMRGMGQSSVPEPGYPWSVDNFANDLLEFADKIELDRFHLIGETVGGSISMRFATQHQERLLSLTACTSPTSFNDPHHGESAELIDKEGVAAWVENTIGRRLGSPDCGPGLHPLVRPADGGHPGPRGGRIPGQRRRRPGAPAQGRANAHPDNRRRQPAGRGAGGLPAGVGNIPQRATGGIPRGVRVCPTRAARALRPSVAGLRPGVELERPQSLRRTVAIAR